MEGTEAGNIKRAPLGLDTVEAGCRDRTGGCSSIQAEMNGWWGLGQESTCAAGRPVARGSRAPSRWGPFSFQPRFKVAVLKADLFQI